MPQSRKNRGYRIFSRNRAHEAEWSRPSQPGVLIECRWVDSEYDGKTKPIPLLLYGREYYDFVANNRGVGRYFAQGDNVVLCWKGKVYETLRKTDRATESPTTGPTDSPSH